MLILAKCLQDEIFFCSILPLMESLLFSLQDNPSKVGNIKQYLLATIINAPATEKNYYRNMVNHDFL